MNDIKFYNIMTYGCQMNVHESEKLAGFLKERGYIETQDQNNADVIVFNTCCIRKSAEEKILGNIGAVKPIKKRNPNLIVAVCGCMSQQKEMADLFQQKFPFVNIIFGTHNLSKFGEFLDDYNTTHKRIKSIEEETYINENVPMFRTSGYNGWVNIMYGCNNFCTYCIVPYVRGREISRQPQDIVDEVESLLKTGQYKVITLLGQNVNSYGKDLDSNITFAKLMQKICELPYDFKLKFMTSHPKDLTDDVIDTIAQNSKISKAIHLPVQSGDDNILKLMGRRYNREKYLNLVNKIRSKIKNVALTTDIIVGFPNESLENFQNTLSLVSEVKYDGAFTFIYSPREGTPAAKMKDNVSMATKKERFNELTKLISKYQADIYKNYENKIVKVLVDGESKKNSQILSGYTEDMKLVNFVGCKNLIGKIVNVKINKAKTYTLEGEVID